MAHYSTNDPHKTYRLSDFINRKDSDKITYSRYSIFNQSITNKNLIYSIDNIIYTYMDEIESMRHRVYVTLNEKIKYQYKPKLLAFDIYGSVETYFIILAMNGMCNHKEFDLESQEFWALAPNDMVNIMNSIYLGETKYINANREHLGIYT